MRQAHQQLQQAIGLDSEIASLRTWFATLPDQRAANCTYSLTDVLMSAYAMFALKYPSLLAFETQTQQEAANLQRLFGIKALCTDAQMRNVLDQFNPTNLASFWLTTYHRLAKIGLLKAYRWLDKYLIVSVDGVEHFHSTKVHCPHCLVKNHRDGLTAYTHSMLCSVLVHPEQAEVFVMGAEPIVCQDGTAKNDCERNAGKRLLDTLALSYKGQPLLFVNDAL
jgi:hypothetical protein